MQQRIAYTSHARWLEVLCLALVVAAALPAGAQDAAPAASPEAQAAGEGPDEAEAPPEVMDVMRVKGRPQTDIDTELPASVTSFNSDQILALGAQNVSDLAKITPNLEIRTTGATSPTFFIRGVGLSDFNANAPGAVAVYQDNVAMNSPALQLGQLFDIEDVNVLRGPQGYGPFHNASAGAIKIRARRPVGNLSANLRASYGNYDYMDYEGAVEFPIVEEELSTRLAFRYTDRDGWGKNRCSGLAPLSVRPPPPVRPPELGLGQTYNGYCGEGDDPPVPVPAGLPEHVNDRGVWAARGIFRWQPQELDMDWLLIARGSRLDQLSTVGQAVGTRGQGGYGTGTTIGGYRDPDITEQRQDFIDECRAAGGSQCPGQADDFLGPIIARNLDLHPGRGDYDRVGKTRLDTWGSSLEGTVPISVGGITLTTITAYEAYDRKRDEDLDFTPQVLFESVVKDDLWQFSQELRAEGELEDEPLQWELGGYYLMEKLNSNGVFQQSRGRRQDRQEYKQDTWSFLVYGDFSWDFLDDFTLESGLRYNWERKRFDYTRTDLQVNVSSGVDDQATWSSVTGGLTLTYRLREDLSVYAKYMHGWKGGHYNAVLSNISEGIKPAKPEKIDSWEAGLSGYWFYERLALSANMFFYKYYNYQVFIIENNLGAFPQVQVINANEAQNYGAEVEGQLKPLTGFVPDSIAGLRIEARFAWLESAFLDFTNQAASARRVSPVLPPVIVPYTVDYSGNPLINSPKFKVSVNAEWAFDLGRWGVVTPRYDGAWSSPIYFDPNRGRGTPNSEGTTDKPKFAVGQPALFLHNFSLKYSPMPNVEFTGWVRNLTDEKYKTYAADTSQFAGLVLNWVGEPRTYGGGISIYW